MEILELSGKSYAVGLYWWRAERESDWRRPRKTARRLAQEIGRLADPGTGVDVYNMMAVHKAGGLIGLGASGRLVRAIALAPALAAARPDAGVLWQFRISPDQLVVVATLAGEVLGDGDYVGDAAGAETRRAMLVEHYGTRLEERVELESVERSRIMLRELLDTVPVSGLPVTEPLNLPRLKPALAGGAFALLAIACGLWWHGSGTVRHGTRIEAHTPPMPASGEMPVRALSPEALLQGCEGSWRLLPLSERGWMLERFSCNGRTAQVLWRYRPGASFVHVPQAAQFPGGAGSGTPDEVLSSMTLGPVARTRIVTRNLDSRMRTEGLFYRLARLAGIGSVEFSWQSGEVGPKATRPWVQAGWRLATRGVNPFSLGANLEALPGIAVEKVAATITGHKLSWVIEGVIYARG